MGTSAKNTHNPLPIYEPFILNVFQMHPAECASEIKGTVALRSAGGFGRLSVHARNGFRRLSAGGLKVKHKNIKTEKSYWLGLISQEVVHLDTIQLTNDVCL